MSCFLPRCTTPASTRTTAFKATTADSRPGSDRCAASRPTARKCGDPRARVHSEPASRPLRTRNRRPAAVPAGGRIRRTQAGDVTGQSTPTPIQQALLSHNATAPTNAPTTQNRQTARTRQKISTSGLNNFTLPAFHQRRSPCPAETCQRTSGGLSTPAEGTHDRFLPVSPRPHDGHHKRYRAAPALPRLRVRRVHGAGCDRTF
jgi:hypothetical protein